ncbi:hypothetical protein E2L06_18605 [Haloterrigena sp. H1]|uniref:hypothetical protein n=1 Tax=Haloterrigena sp. H1 TaxID=2552943 RepID=UPI00110D5FBE|nr:hypothetical protein [Haloterrigena sp. H1]TMT77980.1 hypothetical protein E2L06_20675 [Haloterrigena sp. H1]TMT80265.1 hypothetical protein E2L06_18605 [Haloterrigena sp. H1]
MKSITKYDIPAAIFALLGLIIALLGAGLGIDTGVTILTIPNHSGWVALTLLIAGGAVFFGTIITLLGILFVKNNDFKLPTAILFGALALGFLRLIAVLELIEKPNAGYDGALLLSITLVPVLVWVLLWGIERHWNMSFSQ